MARIRTIKPEFWTSEQVMNCSPMARLLFIGLWNFCDDAGNHVASAKTIKANVFPGDDITSSSIQGLLDELSANELIAYYSYENKDFLHVTGWHHQKIDRPTVKHPPYIPQKTDTTRRVLVEASPPEGNGRDKEGKKENTPSAGADTPIVPPGFIRFWDAWPRSPRKVDKADCCKRWKRHGLESIADQIVEHVEAMCETDQWKRGFEPAPATYLNGRRWEDEMPPTSLSLLSGGAEDKPWVGAV